jgi:hypothetical protein
MPRRLPARRPVFALDAQGYFTRQGRTIIPVGANYWPASCGVEMWQAWPEHEIQADLDLVASLGLNCVRFFLRWQDFEPAPGVYDHRMFDRLHRLLAWHRERKLLAHPSLFVGWMSGGIFWPEWHAGRNVFADPTLRRRAFAFAHKSAAICADFPETVLAMDHGNELCCLPDCQTASPADVMSWCGEVSAAIKRAFPDALVVSGNEQAQVNADRGWRFDRQAGCDFYSMHAYPFPGWHTLSFDGMADPLGQSLLPFYTKCARAFGPVLVQEFGTLLTAGRKQCDAYLRAILPACQAAGANGFLWWCLRDISAPGHPYNKNAFEALLGLVDEHGRVKPALSFFPAFARELSRRGPVPPRPSGVGLLWPEEYYHRDNPSNPGNVPEDLSRQLAIANFCLDSLQCSPRIVRQADLATTPELHTVVIAGAKLTANEAAALVPWVHAGGRLIWHGPDALTWGPDVIRLVGATPVDFCAPSAQGVRVFGQRWDLQVFPRDVFLEVAPGSATIIARDDRQRPVLLSNQLGAGRVITCLALPESQFARESSAQTARSRWLDWYRGVLRLSRLKVQSRPRRVRPRSGRGAP